MEVRADRAARHLRLIVRGAGEVLAGAAALSRVGALLLLLAACGRQPSPASPPLEAGPCVDLGPVVPASTEPAPRLVIQGAHASTIRSLAVSPDGKLLASGSDDGWLMLWDATTGGKLRQLRSSAGRSFAAVSAAWLGGEQLAVWAAGERPSLARAEKGVLGEPFAAPVTNLRRIDRGPIRWAGYAREGSSTNAAENAERLQATLRRYQEELAKQKDPKLAEGATQAPLPSAELLNEVAAMVPQITTRVALLDAAGRELERVPLPPGGYRDDLFAASADGALLVAPADGRTIHLARAMANGWSVEQLSPAIDGGDLEAVALSPAGDTLAYSLARDDAATVHLARLATGDPGCRLPLEATSAPGLAISPDGALLAVASRRALSLWRTRDCSPVWRIDDDVELAPVLASFSPDGKRLYAGGEAGEVRSFEVASGRELARFGWSIRPVHELRYIAESTIATAAFGEIRLWDLAHADTRQLARPEHTPATASIFSSRHGLATATLTRRPCSNEGRTLRLDFSESASAQEAPSRPPPSEASQDGNEGWPAPAGATRELCVSQMTDVLDVAPDQGIVLAQLDGGLGLLDIPRRHGARLPGSERLCPTPRLSPGGRFAAASCVDLPSTAVFVWDTASHQRVAKLQVVAVDVASFTPEQLAAFERLRERGLVPGSAGGFAFHGSGSRIAIESARFIEEYELPSGKRLARHALEGGDVTAVAYAGDRVVAASEDGALHVFDNRGRTSHATAGGYVRELVGSPEGRTVAGLMRDQTVRIWDVTSGELLATLADFDDGEWLATTPAGAYAGTAEVADRLGFVYDAPLERFGFEQFTAYRDRGILRRRLAGEDVDRPARPGRPPRLELASAAPEETTASSVVARVRVSSSRRVEWLRAYVEGRPVAEKPLCAPASLADLELDLLPGQNRVTLVGFDDRGLASNPVTFDIARAGASAHAPDLWVVAVGVSAYPNLPPEAQLGAAADDARGIVEHFRSLAGDQRYGKVHSRLLVDGAATAPAIREALADLEGMRSDDLAIVFFAGHGLKPSASDDMLFLTSGARLDGGSLSAESRARDTIGWDAIARALASARGRVVVLLDACHSGHISQELVVPNEALARALSRDGRAGAIVFAASKGRQLSYEPGSARALRLVGDDALLRSPGSEAPTHGLFTGALLDVLHDPAADRNRDGAFQVTEIIDEVRRRVVRATRGHQTPWVARRDLFGDFTLAPVPKGR